MFVPIREHGELEHRDNHRQARYASPRKGKRVRGSDGTAEFGELLSRKSRECVF